MIANKEIKRLLIKEKSSSIMGTELEPLDLNTYTGIRIENYDTKGNLISAEDTRDIRFEKLRKIQEIREAALESILLEVPLIEQFNMFLMSDTERKKLQAIINKKRQAAKNKKNDCLAATTFDEIDSINTQDI